MGGDCVIKNKMPVTSLTLTQRLQSPRRPEAEKQESRDQRLTVLVLETVSTATHTRPIASARFLSTTVVRTGSEGRRKLCAVVRGTISFHLLLEVMAGLGGAPWR